MTSPDTNNAKAASRIEFVQSQQRFAADPFHSVWVEASAGSGKTTVLIQRLLRLVISGGEPQSILTLTYTTAAAAEIRERLEVTVSSWMRMTDTDLMAAYRNVFGREAPDPLYPLRQRLTYLEINIQDMAIQTFHAFCTSLLRQFPLEADLAPDFHLLEDGSESIFLQNAFQAVLESASRSAKNSRLSGNTTGDLEVIDLADAIDFLATHIPEPTLRSSLQDVMQQRARLGQERDPGSQICLLAEDIFLWRTLPDMSTHAPNNILTNGVFCIKQVLDSDDVPHLEHVADTKNGLALDESQMMALKRWGWSCRIWEDQMGEPQRYFTLHPHDSKPAIQQPAPPADAGATVFPAYLLRQLQGQPSVADRPGKGRSRKPAKNSFLVELNYLRLTESFLRVAYAILDQYQRAKQHRGIVDYDDLIGRTSELLSDRHQSTPWVMANLDRSIRHILIDEGQDTSPQQWRSVIEMVQHILLDKSDSQALPPSLFIVGDFKQSIYSFQGADPSIFRKTFTELDALFRRQQRTLRRVSLGINFRSAPELLYFVDRLFEGNNGVFRHMGLVEWSLHQSAQSDQTGSIVVVSPPETVPRAVRRRTAESSGIDFRNALDIAREQSTTDDKTTDPVQAHCQNVSRYILDNDIPPEDVLILLPRRSIYQVPLTRSLHQSGIPQAASDRLRLGHDGAVLDLRMLLAVALDPYDDFALACLLRSPLVEWDEDQLQALACQRPASLFEALSTHKNSDPAYRWIMRCVELLEQTSLYDFLNRVLSAPCPGSQIQQSAPDNQNHGRSALLFRHGDASHDALVELLNIALSHDGKAMGAASFLALIDGANEDHRRDGDLDRGRGVQIMTVHAAKGREAPVVILPDVLWPTQKSLNQDRIFWHQRIPFPRLNKDLRPSSLSSISNRAEEQNFQETLRLLYVALTRAKSKIIVFPQSEPIDSTSKASASTAASEGLPKQYAWWRLIRDTQRLTANAGDAETPPEDLPVSGKRE